MAGPKVGQADSGKNQCARCSDLGADLSCGADFIVPDAAERAGHTEIGSATKLAVESTEYRPNPSIAQGSARKRQEGPGRARQRQPSPNPSLGSTMHPPHTCVCVWICFYVRGTRVLGAS